MRRSYKVQLDRGSCECINGGKTEQCRCNNTSSHQSRTHLRMSLYPVLSLYQALPRRTLLQRLSRLDQVVISPLLNPTSLLPVDHQEPIWDNLLRGLVLEILQTTYHMTLFHLHISH